MELANDATAVNDGWVMTRDNVTGLVWEIKNDTDDWPTGIHRWYDSHNWCDTNDGTNGGNQGNCGTTQNTKIFLEAINGENYGGHSDWRLPTIKELASLIDSGTSSADLQYFPYPDSISCWSATTDISAPDMAWVIGTANYPALPGSIFQDYKSYSTRCVRAVRSAL